MVFAKYACWLLAFIAAIGVGYWLAQPTYCCAFPGNKEFIDYIAAWSGPFAGVSAIVIAVFNERKNENRFERALKQQNSLDKKADDRQQNEWGRRKEEQEASLFERRRNSQIAFEKGIGVYMAIVEHSLELSQHGQAELIPEEVYSPYRVYLNYFEAKPEWLYPYLIPVVSIFESKIWGHTGKLRMMAKKEYKLHYDEVRRELEELLSLLKKYSVDVSKTEADFVDYVKKISTDTIPEERF